MNSRHSDFFRDVLIGSSPGYYAEWAGKDPARSPLQFFLRNYPPLTDGEKKQLPELLEKLPGIERVAAISVERVQGQPRIRILERKTDPGTKKDLTLDEKKLRTAQQREAVREIREIENQLLAFLEDFRCSVPVGKDAPRNLDLLIRGFANLRRDRRAQFPAYLRNLLGTEIVQAVEIVNVNGVVKINVRHDGSLEHRKSQIICKHIRRKIHGWFRNPDHYRKEKEGNGEAYREAYNAAWRNPFLRPATLGRGPAFYHGSLQSSQPFPYEILLVGISNAKNIALNLQQKFLRAVENNPNLNQIIQRIQAICVFRRGSTLSVEVKMLDPHRYSLFPEGMVNIPISDLDIIKEEVERQMTAMLRKWVVSDLHPHSGDETDVFFSNEGKPERYDLCTQRAHIESATWIQNGDGLDGWVKPLKTMLASDRIHWFLTRTLPARDGKSILQRIDVIGNHDEFLQKAAAQRKMKQIYDPEYYSIQMHVDLDEDGGQIGHLHFADGPNHGYGAELGRDDVVELAVKPLIEAGLIPLDPVQRLLTRLTPTSIRLKRNVGDIAQEMFRLKNRGYLHRTLLNSEEVGVELPVGGEKDFRNGIGFWREEQLRRLRGEKLSLDERDAAERNRLRAHFIVGGHTHLELPGDVNAMLAQDGAADGFETVGIQSLCFVSPRLPHKRGDYQREPRFPWLRQWIPERIQRWSVREIDPTERVLIFAPERMWVVESTDIADPRKYFSAGGPGEFWANRGFGRMWLEQIYPNSPPPLSRVVA